MISGKAKVCGIIAYPVAHSLSPMMHNFYAEQMGIDFAYVPFQVPEDEVEAAVKGAYALNLAGLNVTVPHKQRVIPYLKELDPAAQAIGAVNTLVRIPGGYKGYNTDAPGLFRAMTEAGMRIEGADCLILGAGGAAKAAAFVLGSRGAASAVVLNRTKQRAVELAEEMNQKFGRTFLSGMALSDYGKLPAKSWLAIQTTSVGMHPHPGEAPLEDPAFYQNIHSAVDVIYTPCKTRFMTLVGEAGGRAVNGLDMLIYQGIEAFELWNPGHEVTKPVMEQAKERLLGQLMR